MHINVGDLVKCGREIGIVVEKKISNEGLVNSKHVQHMLHTYPSVFYVYFSEAESRMGPYFERDLTLQQTR